MKYHYAIVFLFIVASFFLFQAKNKHLRHVSIILLSWIFYYSYCQFNLFILIYITTVAYFSGIVMPLVGKKHSRYFLLFSLLGLIAPIAFYKYTLPFISQLNTNTNSNYYLGITDFNLSRYIVPLGISYYTYQAISYVIDVYRSRIQPAKNPLLYYAFNSYYPQLFIGPISRFSDMEKELTKNSNFDSALAMEGLFLIIFGLFKKIIISESLNPVIKNLFFYENNLTFSWIAIFITPFFLFFDFSSYSDICRGISKMFNIQLTSNFESPLTKKTVSSFWTSWHISLYLWLRDYIYLPLLSVSTKKYMIYIWILMSFTLSGLWHGPETKFVIVGAIAALFITFESLIKDFFSKRQLRFFENIFNLFSNVYTYFVVSFIFLFYLSPNTSTYLKLLKSLIGGDSSNFGTIGLNDISLKSKLALFTSFIFISLEHNRQYWKIKLLTLPKPIQWLVTSFSIIILLLFYKSSLKPFIYFFS